MWSQRSSLVELLREVRPIVLDEERPNGVRERRHVAHSRFPVERDEDVEAFRARRLRPAWKAQPLG